MQEMRFNSLELAGEVNETNLPVPENCPVDLQFEMVVTAAHSSRYQEQVEFRSNSQFIIEQTTER